MLQWLSRGLLIVVSLLAIAFGALNGGFVELDLLMAQWRLPLGVALLAFLVLGVLIGASALYLLNVFPLKRELANLKRRTQTPS
jgi:uncharacterized integral membrane protein